MKKPDKKPQEIEIEIRATGIPMVGGDNAGNEIVSIPKGSRLIPWDEGWFMAADLPPYLRLMLEDEQRKEEARQAQIVNLEYAIARAFGIPPALIGLKCLIDNERIRDLRDALNRLGVDLSQERADRIFPWAAGVLLLALAILTAILVVPHVP